jgi:hypothetical protein
MSLHSEDFSEQTLATIFGGTLRQEVQNIEHAHRG